MPTPAFCALEDAYGSWGKVKKNEQKDFDQSQLHQGNQGHQQQGQQGYQQQGNQGHQQQGQQGHQGHQQQMNVQHDSNPFVSNNQSFGGDIRSFCPNCSNCLNANNILQQKIIDQNIWPRPRWIPQYPDAYENYDPYDRYWMNNNVSRVEHFGNASIQDPNKVENLLQLILIVLIALFVLQAIDMILKYKN
jgi:hypothetical protein